VKKKKNATCVCNQKDFTDKSTCISHLTDNRSHDTSILTIDTDIPYNPTDGISTSISESTLQMIDNAVKNTVDGVDVCVFDLSKYKKLIDEPVDMSDFSELR